MQREIYLAGGCFWGVEKYLQAIAGVLATEVGYANGNSANPSYEDVCYRNTDHAETVKTIYDDDKISLPALLKFFYRAINPLELNRQGPDRGRQYRSGIYYADTADLPLIEESLQNLQQQYAQQVMIEALPLHNYYPAEEYHQQYLAKNPTGYCHISADKLVQAADLLPYPRKSDEQLCKELTALQYAVTREKATEPPFSNEYNNEFAAGIYVDITSDEPLFSSKDKFACSCGWPAFSRPISGDLVAEVEDLSLGMRRIEVRSKKGDAHLGHVFDDGPPGSGGLRYCINSAALRFIPAEEMADAGYGDYLHLV